MALPVAVETLKERFMVNLTVINRLADERRELVQRVEELETQLHCRSFQPWWEYAKNGSPARSPRSPRSARLARDYNEMRGVGVVPTPRSARTPRSSRSDAKSKELLSASAAAKLFEAPRPKPLKGVGLSKHLLADNDRHRQQNNFLVLKEKTELEAQNAYLNSKEQRRREQLLAKNSIGPFKGVEKRAKDYKEKADARASDRMLKLSLDQRAEEENRRQKHLEHLNKPLSLAVSWDMIQANEETTRRERIENRKMKLHASQITPEAARPLPPKPEPEPISNQFVAEDPSQVRRRLLRKPNLLKKEKSNGEQDKLLAKNQRLEIQVSRKNMAQEHRLKRLNSAKQREMESVEREILASKEQLERLFNSNVPLDARRPNRSFALRAAMTAAANSAAYTQVSGAKLIEDVSRPKTNWSSSSQQEYRSKERESESKERESESKEKESHEKEYIEKRSWSSSSKQERSNKRPVSGGRQGPTLMERHSALVEKNLKVDQSGIY